MRPHSVIIEPVGDTFDAYCLDCMWEATGFEDADAAGDDHDDEGAS